MAHKQYLDVIHLEDDVLDAQLIHAELNRHQIACRIERIRTEEQFESALQSNRPDVILSDSNLPGYNTWKALALVGEVCPSTPFIFISGTSSSELKVDAVCLGATDFICKNNLKPLVRQLRRIWKSKIQLPETGAPVLVQCKKFRCLGYLDETGAWRDYQTSEELSDIILWQEVSYC